jgi:hypothetical protein
MGNVQIRHPQRGFFTASSCVSASLIDAQHRVDGIGADFPSPAALAQGICSKPLEVCGSSHTRKNVNLNAITLAVVGAVALFVKMSTGALEEGRMARS